MAECWGLLCCLDDEGGRVPSGVYLYHLGVKAQKGEAQQSGTVAVVY